MFSFIFQVVITAAVASFVFVVVAVDFFPVYSFLFFFFFFVFGRLHTHRCCIQVVGFGVFFF